MSSYLDNNEQNGSHPSEFVEVLIAVKLQNYAVLRQRGIEFWVWRDWGDNEFWGMEMSNIGFVFLFFVFFKC